MTAEEKKALSPLAGRRMRIWNRISETWRFLHVETAAQARRL
jgi:hypothetical protein